MSEMIKCQHCGAFVPSEKAFCPNCSEPMEPEEKPNRAHSFSSDMLSTIRDDPEKYKDLLMPGAKKKQQQQPAPAQTPPVQTAAPRVEPSVANYSIPQAAPMPPLPVGRKSNRPLFFGIGAIVLLALIIALLIIFKVI